MIIAATNATDLTTGDAQATGSPIWTRKRKLYLAIFVGLAALQQGYRLAILRNLHVSPISPYLPFRRPANYTTIFDYNISSSAGMSLTQITWESSPGIFQEVDVCHFKNLCVKNYSGQSLAGKQRYWLAPTEDGKSEAIAENELTKAETAFRRCLNSPFTPVPDFSLKPLLYDPQRVAWLKGHSYASVKADFGAHPITWLNVWSRLVSLAANVPDLLSSFGISHRNFFDHIVVSICLAQSWRTV